MGTIMARWNINKVFWIFSSLEKNLNEIFSGSNFFFLGEGEVDFINIQGKKRSYFLSKKIFAAIPCKVRKVQRES